MSLYPTSTTSALDPATFRDPGPEYRGAPFWSWNGKLDRDRLLRQTGWLAEMGLGGWCIHSRTGLDTPYLSPEFMAHVQACVEDGRRRGGLRTWLYDEDRWPSGFAGGQVTADPAFRARHILFTPRANAETGPVVPTTPEAVGGRTGEGILLARYAVALDAAGCLAGYRRLAEGAAAAAGERVWYAYLETMRRTTWYNHQTHPDQLNPAAMRRFVELTHERYRAAVGADFGGLIPAIFTDEPQFLRKQALPTAHGLDDAMLPWTPDLPASYRAAFAADVLDSLPELFWDLPGRVASLARWRYHEHTAERFAAAFADVIGTWCEDHGIALTGHLMDEVSLESQTRATGESMRAYRGFQIPGIDMLSDDLELTTAKQAQSAKHQYGRQGMLSELYGVTDWDFPFAGHKRQGDWQAALGVTVRVHHLAWVGMQGEAKRDFPASISYQSPWFREYPAVEDHFARVNAALTRGTPVVRVAMVHPIESYWLEYGPRDATAAAREAQERVFQDAAAWLCYGNLDFDYLAESLLPSLCPQGGAPLAVGAMRYDAVVVPPLRSIRAATLDRLAAFAAAGGRLVFLGDPPELVGCVRDARATALAARCTRIACDRAALLAALAPVREVEVLAGDGSPAGCVLGQLRQDGTSRHLFVCNTDRRRTLPAARLRLRGAWTAELLDTLDGSRRPLAVRQQAGWSEVACDLPVCGSVLITWSPGAAVIVAEPSAVTWHGETIAFGRCPVELSEPNALLLDQAEWRLDDGAWQPHEEILRLDNALRRALGLGERNGDIAQPWSDTRPAPVLGTATLRFRIRCEAAATALHLALEDLTGAAIRLDGVTVPAVDAGWWVDEDTRLVALPDLVAGEHVLEVVRPYTRRSGLEWHYLLGDFGVRLEGRDAVVTGAVRDLACGDWCAQGLPFYSGNLTYRLAVETDGRPCRLALPHLGGILARVALDGRDLGRIWLPPWRLDLGAPAAGRHALAITVFSHRRNAFGAVHCHDPRFGWWGPPAWRVTGDAWAYEYALRPLGLLTAPLLEHPGDSPARPGGCGCSAR